MKVKTKGQLKIEIKQAEREIVRPGSELESTQTEAARHTKEVGQVSASTNWEDVYRTQTSPKYRVERGYTTCYGDGDTESVALFASRQAALAAARAEVSNLRVTNRDRSVITDQVMVEELDADGEPIGQPIFWVKADDIICVPARLTYREAPAALADGKMEYNTWYTIYDRLGRIVVETTDEDTANRAAAQFDEIVEAEMEVAS